MRAKGIFGAYVATAPASGADNADAASNEHAIQHQPILHYGIDEQECWLARWCAAPGVRISWRKGRCQSRRMACEQHGMRALTFPE